MTNIEAIERLKNAAWLGSDNERDEIENAVYMAILALKEQEQDGCDGCKYTGKDQYEMPCIICSKSHKNMYKLGDSE